MYHHLLSIWVLIAVIASTVARNVSRHSAYDDGPNYFFRAASATKTDKVTAHAYQFMYGTFFPQMHDIALLEGKRVKFLEIGLGCIMSYGAGGSIPVWQAIFGDLLDLWVAEIDEKCVQTATNDGKLDGLSVLIGDQSNITDLNRWITSSGGNFSIIVDDGGHQNGMQLNSIRVLWDAVLPGGFYVIEDLQVGYHANWRTAVDEAPMIDILNSWNEQLVMGQTRAIKCRTSVPKDVMAFRRRYPLLKNVKFILMQRDACLIAKCSPKDPDCHWAPSTVW